MIPSIAVGFSQQLVDEFEFTVHQDS